MNRVIYKIATEQEEFEQIHKLNYETFVEEIPQHEENENHQLVDKFHEENTYVIAKDGAEVVGMIAIRAERPFSLDSKLEDLESYLPLNGNPCEVRLLSVKKAYRSTRVFYQLCAKLLDYCLEKGYTMALISGTVRQLKLYKHMGFMPFGPLLGHENARFQPMYLTKESFERSTKAFERLMSKRSMPRRELSFLPGPVPIHPKVKKAFSKTAISHRSIEFKESLKNLRIQLCDMTGANYAEVVVGTGTLSNDLVAAQLQNLSGDGLILANGEFGNRLIDHAKRFQLTFQTIEKKWNEPILLAEIEFAINQNPSIKWIWTVHCETSTGYLYDLEGIQGLCKEYGLELCVDACSTAGMVPLDLKETYLASTVSGKGFGSYPGLAIVFHREKIRSSNSVPRYLDLKMYEDHQSIPYTHSSNLVNALHEALKLVDYEYIQSLSSIVRELLRAAGCDLLGDNGYSPGIITIRLPNGMSSREFGDQCKKNRILISYESEYLLQRNWFQIALMGAQDEVAVLESLKIVERIFSSKIRNGYVYETI